MPTIQLKVSKEWCNNFNLGCIHFSNKEENEFIIEEGYNSLCRHRKLSLDINKKNIELKVIEEEKRKFLKMKDDYKNELIEEQQKYKAAEIAKETAEKCMREQNKTIQKKIDDTVQLSSDKYNKEIKKIKEELDIAKKELDIAKKENTAILQKNYEDNKNFFQEKEISNNKLRESYETKLDDLRKEYEIQLEKEREKTNMINIRLSNSSLKGKDNEDEFENLLNNTFGISEHYKYLPKKHHSGDHLIKWEGCMLMFENKNVQKKSTLSHNNGLPKAHRDFQNNLECDALIFVSQKTSIPGHSRPGDIDFDNIGGRPIIYIGNFYKHDNKVDYMLSIVMPILRLMLKLYKNVDINDDEKLDNLNNKMRQIQILVGDLLKNLKENKNKINNFKNEIEDKINELKNINTKNIQLTGDILKVITEVS